MVDSKFGSGGGVLEITLDAGPDDDDFARSPERIDHEYTQHTLKGITHSFQLFDDIYMNHSLIICNPMAFRLKFFRSKDVEQNNINLTYLDPKPGRMVHMAWKWLTGGLAAIFLASILVYVGRYSGFSIAHETMFPAGILLGTFGLIALMLFYYKTHDKVIYKSTIGQVPIFELFHMPRKKAYSDFIDILEKSIYKAQHRKDLSMKNRLAGELKYLRKMKENGLIAVAEYDAAMSRILGHEGHRT